MGRTKRYEERMVIPVVKGTFRRIDKVSKKHEYRTDVIRGAIEREIQLRENEGVKPADA